jgi:hypothetical protein
MKIPFRTIGLEVLLVLVITQFLTGCLGSSGIRTMIHEDPQSQVYLDWVPKESFRASHPQYFSPILIKHILSGVMVQPPPGIIEGLLGEDPKPSPLFSNDDVELLVPHLVSALSQVTPEEQVVFQRTYSQESQTTKTAGTIHVKEGLLYLTITDLGRTKNSSTVTFYKGNREVPDSSGLRDVQISFAPETAWRQDMAQHSVIKGQSSPNLLVLDYKVLASL